MKKKYYIDSQQFPIHYGYGILVDN